MSNETLPFNGGEKGALATKRCGKLKEILISVGHPAQFGSGHAQENATTIKQETRRPSQRAADVEHVDQG